MRSFKQPMAMYNYPELWPGGGRCLGITTVVPGTTCTQSDVSNQTPSDPNFEGTEICSLISGGGACGIMDSVYVVTDLEDDSAGDFCYGYQSESFTQPAGPFTISWSGNAWVSFTDDDGIDFRHHTYSGNYGFTAKMNDVRQSLKYFAVYQVITRLSC